MFSWITLINDYLIFSWIDIILILLYVSKDYINRILLYYFINLHLFESFQGFQRLSELIREELNLSSTQN